MLLGCFLKELGYTKRQLPYIARYEQEFLRERSIELGVNIYGIIELEDLFQGKNLPKSRRDSIKRGLVVYYCPQLDKAMTAPEWKKYFDYARLSPYHYAYNKTKYLGKYSFIRQENL